MATISDVATRAGVSTATVSRALNGKSTVDPDLTARVLTAADDLGYRPNGPARNLRKQETAVLALIISDVESPFFTALSRGAEDVAHAAGYSLVLCNSDDDPDKEREYLEVALQERVAGVLLSPSGRGDSARILRSRGTPVVAVDRPLPHSPGDTVLADTRAAAKQAVLHLVEQGYERIGCLTGPTGVPTAEDRLAGYRDGLQEAGAPQRAEWIRRCEFKSPGAKEATGLLMDQDVPPDGLLVANNVMAVGVLESLAEHGFRAGRDVGVVAFDDAPWATLLEPPLTVVSQPAYAMGETAARLLLSRIAGESTKPSTTTLSASLVLRGSSTRTDAHVAGAP